MIAANGFAQGVIDVHSHLITPEFVSALETEGRVMDEGAPFKEMILWKNANWLFDQTGEKPAAAIATANMIVRIAEIEVYP